MHECMTTDDHLGNKFLLTLNQHTSIFWGMLAKWLGFLDARNVQSSGYPVLQVGFPCVSAVSASCLHRGRKAKVWREAWCRFQETQKATLELDVVTYGITISATIAGSKWQHANGLVQDLKGSLEKKIDFQQVESLRFPKSDDFFLWFFLGWSFLKDIRIFVSLVIDFWILLALSKSMNNKIYGCFRK